MTDHLPLKVLIVGGGVSGLMMAILLERAGINYVVIEKQKSFKPSSRAVCLSAVVLPVLEQLGLLNDIMEIARPVGTFNIVTHKFDKVGELSLKSFEARYGYATVILPRPSFYNILLSRIPKEKIVLGRRVLSISQSANGVLVRCNDGTNFSGDILIGADGGNSSVRQNLYKHIETLDGDNVLYPQYTQQNKKGGASANANQHTNHPPSTEGDQAGGKIGGVASAILKSTEQHRIGLFSCPNQAKKAKFLPESDVEPMEYDALKVTGLTAPLDGIEEINESNFTIVVGKDRRYTLWMIPMADRRMGWSIDLNLQSKKAAKDQEEAFKVSQYGPESIDEICNVFRDHLSPIPGMTLGDLIDTSPPHLLQRTLLQQKVFETWYGGRVVLIGDACHKFVPTAGQSDVCNIADCVLMANLLHELKSNTLTDIQAMFEAYRNERYPVARKALSISRHMQALFVSNSLVASVVRMFTFKRGVDYVYSKVNDSAHARRMLITFLQYPPHRGEFTRIDPTPSSRLTDHLPVFNSYEATKAYLAKASEVINNQRQATEEARRKQQQEEAENRLYHYHHSYRHPSSSAASRRSDGNSTQEDLSSTSPLGDYYPARETSSRSSSTSREMNAFGSQFSSSS